MACGGVVFELYRRIECDDCNGEDQGYCLGLLKTGDDGSYIKMGQQDSSTSHQQDSSQKFILSMEPYKTDPPSHEYLFKQSRIGDKFTFTNLAQKANLVGNIKDLNVYGMKPESLTGECSDKWLLKEGSSDGVKRLCVIDDDNWPFYFCIDNDQKLFYLRKGCESEQGSESEKSCESEPDGEFEIRQLVWQK